MLSRYKAVENARRVHHHVIDVLKKMRRVGVFFGVAKGMVHTVHNGIRPRHQKRGALHKPGEQVKHFFPRSAYRVHLMRRITVQEKRVKKQRQKPMQDEEQ
jgi:hypothetical protein